MTNLTSACLDTIDAALLDDLGGDTSGIELFSAECADATVSNQHYQVAYSTEAGCVGIVFCGSGSSGASTWIDCTSPEAGFASFLADCDDPSGEVAE